MLGKIPATRLALIEKIVTHALKGLPRERHPLAREFLGAFFRGVAEEDLRAHRPADLATAALAHLEFGRRRTGDEVRVDIAPPLNVDAPTASHRALLRVVTPDMPFLVDSIGIVFSQMNIAVHLIVHPVLAVRRDSRGTLKTVGIDRRDSQLESWQMMEIDRPRDAAAAQDLEQRVRAALEDVRRSVTDFRAMLERIRAVANELERVPLPVPKSHASEARALLAWMHDGHFVFLGYRHYQLRRGRSRDALVRDSASGLGILREPASSRKGSRKAPPPIVLTGHLRQQARAPELLLLTKANTPSTVHRGSYLDYVGVKTFDASGQVSGEHRFLGLWTSSAYHKPPAEIPLLRRKLEAVIAHFGLPAQSHDAKSVVNVIETFPRDELFQTPLSELIASVRGIVNLYERRRVRLFVRRDSFERFYSCLVYVPRDRYNTEVRERIERIVRQRFGGTHVETQVQISDSMLARLHMLVRTQQGARNVEDIPAIEAEIAAAATTWEDRLQQALISRGVERSAVELAARYAKSFPPAYRADVEPAQALDDIADLESLAADPTVPQINLRARPNGHLSLRILQASEPISISDILPMLENFGLRVLAERPYQVTTTERTVWIQDFELEARDLKRADIAALEPLFKEAFLAAWRGDIENDGFNRLLLCASLSAREIVVVRAYCRYLLQTGIPFSQAYMERVLVAQAPITGALVRLFQTQFALDNRARESAAERTAKGILRALDKVASLDEDRILRSYLNVIRATLRTNYYQSMDGNGKTKSWVSFKLDPHAIPDLPLPRPKFEIFVYSPRVEGVHMRMGYVARGGLRWSDRREDFRTEVLGLMKAQHVKNTVIVPVGAKGGFYPKRLPAGGSREDVQKEVVASYQTFIRGLLDVTDNFVNGKITVRPGIVRRDGDDAYLVVAADKGTATFSDIANAISIEYGHWLGDAFASGGSAGYDHKGMGITARGAWECVKRHFRELGVDIQSQEFSCAGVGDMSGDVFGNGMLLSKQTRLVAAFDHRHIFLDPNPLAAAGFRERERLFKLPRSSWDDYSRKLISRGGGVWPRSAKSIPLSAEAQKLLDLALPAATPVEVMRAILRMRVDLLWNGGIGTYVKAADETHAEVRDRANDAIRADGREIRAKVVGEGGNLGCTQRGRVEYSQSGGRINTDFIDNSAGVNTSDVEVNIKILLSEVERRGRLPLAARNKLLASMTDEVASLVLRNNYLQTQALSVLEQRAPERLAEYQSLIRELERNGNLDRAIEFLPGDDEFLERRKQRLGLTRPELAVVLAYSKIWLSNHLLDSDLPDDPYFASEVQRYFPAPMRKRYSREITRHRLRREIVATATTNSLVNRMGPVFVARAQEETEADPAAISRAYTIAREIFSMRSIWADIESLDNQVPADVQYGMFFRTSRLLRHTSYWLLREKASDLHIENSVRELLPGVEQLTDCIDAVIGGESRAQHDATLAGLGGSGVPEKLARRVAQLSLLEPALDIVALARAEHMPVADVARAYFELGVLLGLDWLHGEIDRLVVDGSWQATARSSLRDAAMRAHRELTHQVLNTRGAKRVGERVERWNAQRAEALASWQRTLTEMRAVGSTDFATLTVGVEAVRGLSSG